MTRSRLPEAARRGRDAVAGVLLALGFGLAIAGGPAAAAPGITTQVAPSVIHIGDTVTVSVTITPGDGVQPVAPGTKVGSFEILGATPPHDAPGGARALDLFLTTFETGSQTIPPIAIGVAAGGRIDSVRTSPWRVSVESLLPADTTQADSARIKPARPPMSLSQRFRWGVAFGYLVVLGLLGLAAVWAWRRWRASRRPGVAAASPPVPARPPLEVALSALREIEARGYVPRGLYKEHYSQSLDVARGFIEGELSIEALDRTTFELMQALERAPLAAGSRRELARLLDEADLVKFARWTPPSEAAGALIDRVRLWVQALATDRAMARASASTHPPAAPGSPAAPRPEAALSPAASNPPAGSGPAGEPGGRP